MAKQVIYLGAAAGDNTGTKLRTGGDMINDNFTELYDFVSHGLFGYLTAPANTTVVDNALYYPIAGTFGNTPTNGFSFVATPAIKYDVDDTHYFEIHCHATLSCNKASRTVLCGIKKNGVLVQSSVMSQFLRYADESSVIGGVCVVELSLDDEIQLVVSSSNDGDIVTFNNLTASIKPFLL
jgi:hypothetical protein